MWPSTGLFPWGHFPFLQAERLSVEASTGHLAREKGAQSPVPGGWPCWSIVLE